MSVPASPEQLHGALMYCINFAKTMLEDAGDFYPFGAMLTADGQVTAIGGDLGDPRPDQQQLFQFLSAALSAEVRSGRAVGVALAANVNIPPQYTTKFRDGLRVQLESRGFARLIYVPYQLKRTGLLRRSIAVDFDEPFSVEVAATLFPAPDGV